jgi:hypothetical protein
MVPTILSTGHEIGEIIEMGEPTIVVGENAEERHPEVRSVEFLDEETISVEGWNDLSIGIQKQIATQYEVKE